MSARTRQLLRAVRRGVSQDPSIREELARIISTSASSSAAPNLDDADDDVSDDDDAVGALAEHVSNLLGPVLQHVPEVSFSITEEYNNRDTQFLVIIVFNLSRTRNPPTLPETHEWQDWTVQFKWMDVDPPSILSDDRGAVPPLSRDAIAILRPVIYAAQRRFHRHQNVVGVLAGYVPDTSAGGWTTQPALLVVVHHKGYVALGESRLPRTFKGVPVCEFEGRYTAAMPPRIQEMEHDRPLGTIRVVDPLRSGCSIGLLGMDALGTLGGFVVDENSPGAVYLLTNAHVVQESIDDGTTWITQPSGPDKIRDSVRTLEQQESLSTQNRAPRSEIRCITRQIARVRTEAPWSSAEDERYVIARPPFLHKRGDKRITREDNTREHVGVDMALCEYMGDRLIDVRVTVPPDMADVAQTHAYTRWNVPCDEDNDMVVKDGRSTGLTAGKPTPLTGSVDTRLLGVYLLVRGDTPDTAHYQLREDTPVLHNQYLVKHERATHQFAVEGDSGSVCYIRDYTRRWQLRPWGLLHGALATNAWNYAVISPIEAVMASMPPGYQLVSPDNQHLLGDRRAVVDEEDDDEGEEVEED